MKIKTILIILIGSLVISLLINLQAYMAKKVTEIEINALRNENGLLYVKIDEAVRDYKQLQDKINALSNDLTKVSQERENLEKEKADIQELYKAAVKEKDALVEKIKVQEAPKEEQKKSFSLSNSDSYWADILKAKADLETQLGEAYSQLRIAQSQNEELRQDKKNLELELASRLETDRGQLETTRGQLETTRIKTQADSAPSAKESIELPPIVVRLQAGASSVSPDKQMSLRGEKGKEVHLGGSILGVDKENNFVLIDLGRSAGLEVGNILQVYRGIRAIATIEVIQARENISACNIKEKVSSPEVGDRVR